MCAFEPGAIFNAAKKRRDRQAASQLVAQMPKPNMSVNFADDGKSGPQPHMGSPEAAISAGPPLITEETTAGPPPTAEETNEKDLPAEFRDKSSGRRQPCKRSFVFWNHLGSPKAWTMWRRPWAGLVNKPPDLRLPRSSGRWHRSLKLLANRRESTGWVQSSQACRTS